MFCWSDKFMLQQKLKQKCVKPIRKQVLLQNRGPTVGELKLATLVATSIVVTNGRHFQLSYATFALNPTV